jgi:regulator of sigma E protease
VGEVTPQSLAEQAGFQSGYQIVAVNEQSTMRWESVIQATLQQMLSNKNELVYSVQNQQGQRLNLSLNIQGLTIDDVAEGNFFDKLGIHPFRSPFPAIIGEIMPNSAAEKAGLQQGDKIIALDNQPISDWSAWARYVNQRPLQEISAEIERNHQPLKLTLIPDNIDGKGRMGVYAPYFVTERYNLWQAVTQGIEKTWDISILTLRVMVKMLTLQISHEHISGPITIAQFAGQTAQMGFSVFLSFLGLVSVSLGVINLLPIPLLDGGHLFFYFLEWIKGNPVTEQTEYLLQRIGMVLLLGLMGLAIFNDLGRIFS